MERRQRRWWTRGITWLSLLAIMLALVSAAFQVAVWVAPGYRAQVAQLASQALGQPVRVQKLTLAWRWLWPLLELDDVQVLDASVQQPVLDIGRVRLGFALGELLHGDWVPAEVSVADLALDVGIDVQGVPHVRGFAGQQPPPALPDVLRQLRRFSRIRVERLALTVDDARVAAPAFTVVLRQGDLRLTDQGFEWRSDWQAPEVLADRLRLNAGVTGPLDDPAQWLLRWTLDASGLQPGAALQARWPWLQPLRFERARVQAAGEWRAGMPGDSDLSFGARAVRRLGVQPAQLANVDIGLHFRPSAQGGSVEIAPLRLTGLRGAWPAGTARLQWQGRWADAQYQLNADHLRLDDLGRWLAPYAPASLKLPPGVPGSLAGDIDGLDLRWQAPAAADVAAGTAARPLRLAYQAAFRGLGAGAAGEPGLTALDGRIDGDEQSGRLQLQGHDSRLTLPQVWAAPVPLEQLAIDARWQRDDGRWQLTLPAFTVGVLGAHLQGRAELHDALDEARVLRLDSTLAAGDVAALKALMPLHWGEPLKQWLDHALVRGRVSNGRLAIDGPLRDFPFHQHPGGHWGLDFRVSNARLDYHHDWPAAEALDATLRFAGNGLGFEVRRALISGVEVTGVTGGIEDFSQSPLLIDGRTRAAAARYYEFLRNSPLAGRLSGLTEHSRIDGDADVGVHLEIPLHSGLGQKTVASGTVAVQAATLHHDALDVPVTDITGTLQFGGGHGVAAEGLSARFYETPVQARIAPDSDGSDELTADMKVDYQQSQGIAVRYLPDWLRDRFQGKSWWHLRLPLGGAQAGHVQVTSDLAGTVVRLPPPLGKAAATSMPVSVSVTSDVAAPVRVAVQVADKLATQLRFVRDGGLHLRGVGVRFGSSSLPPADENGVRVTGTLDEVPIMPWIDLIGSLRDSAHAPASGPGAPEAPSLAYLGTTLSAQHLQLGGYQWPPVNLGATPGESGGIDIVVSGAGNQGVVRVAGDGGSLRGDFEQLTLQAQPETHDDPVAPADKTAVTPPLSPDRLPTLQLAVKALQVGGRPFGQLQLATERVAGGQRLTTARLEGGIARVEAQGEWRRQQGTTTAATKFDLASDDLAGTLSALGFVETVSGRNARITGDLVWPAATAGFNWADAQGPVGLSAEHGALRNVEPGGASRVLGLFNFFVLPRRLLLDFRDVVSKGMSFDQIDGHFRLAGGVAQTDDLAVRSPAFKIAVRGKIGLAARDVDQTITVTPNTSTLSLGALLAGGSAVALVGPFAPLVAVIANQVLDKPIAQATQLTYRLTGRWDNPEIRKLDGSPVNDAVVTPAAAAPPAAAGSSQPLPQDSPP